jgi:hypothetical protein
LEFQRLRTVRSIFDPAIPFDSLVPLLATIRLTAVKHESLSFFQRNKDPKAYVGKFWNLVRFQKIVWILVNRFFFFDFCLRGQQFGWMCQKKVFFRRFDKKAFSVKRQETLFSECNKTKGWWTLNLSYFFLISAWLAVNRQKRARNQQFWIWKWELENLKATTWHIQPNW